MARWRWATVGTLGEPLTGGLIGGVVVLGSPTAAIAETISTLRSVALINPLFAVDEEGGRVQRLRALLGRLPSAEQQATDNTPVELQELVALHGEQVSDLGFDMIPLRFSMSAMVQVSATGLSAPIRGGWPNTGLPSWKGWRASVWWR